MINHDDSTIELNNQVEKIVSFDVWWMTPFGLVVNYDTAKMRMVDNDLPLMLLKPVVVAMTRSGLYEPLV